MKIKTKLKIGTTLDMTPLIDVVFLLIIFFMLSSSFILQPGIKVDLPNSPVNEPQPDTSVEITITKENIIFYNAERINVEQLNDNFKKLALTSINSVIVIKADGKVQHEKVVEVMALAKKYKLNKLAIATKPENER